MKFLTYEKDSRRVPAVMKGGRAVALGELGYPQASLEQFIIEVGCGGLAEFSKKLAAYDGGLPIGEVKPVAAIAEPTQEIIIMENNYVRDDAEAAEFAAYLKQTPSALPTYFYKKATLASDDGGIIPSYPGHVEALDYQAELCAVLGRDAFKVAESDAGGFIFGYTVINNVIARNLTARHRRPYIATGLDGFLPMCSFVVTADEFCGRDIAVRSYVNGELRQNDTTAHLKFGAQYAIFDLTRSSVLRAGSILSLGTPFGSGKDMSPETYLKSGDVVTCEAVGVGSVTSTVK